MSQPHTHLLEVEARLRWREGAAPPARADLVMPVWTPGSYLVREFERHVQDFAAQDGAGRALQWSKANKNTWRVETAGARDVRVRYSVYANELTVRTNELNDRHAFWNNSALLLYPEGHLAAPSTVRVVPREGWKIATGLAAVSGERNTFRAENFDILYDSPFLVSDFKVLTFEVRGVPHRIVVDGEGNYDPERMRRDVQKVAEANVELMKTLPVRDYTFILMTHPTASGGLEHLNSTALIWRRHCFRPEASLARLSRPRLARILPPLERQAHPPGRARPLRLHARELHAPAVGRRGRHELLRRPARAPRRADDRQAVPRRRGRLLPELAEHAGPP